MARFRRRKSAASSEGMGRTVGFLAAAMSFWREVAGGLRPGCLDGDFLFLVSGAFFGYTIFLFVIARYRLCDEFVCWWLVDPLSCVSVK